MARPEKEAIVKEVSEDIKNSKSMVITDYLGLDVSEITELRKQLREAGVKYKVVKNTLAKIASSNTNMEVIDEYLKGPTAIAYGIEDAVSPAKVLVDFAKDHEVLEIKAGVLNGEIMSVDQVKSLAEIPSREVLLAKVLAGMKSPISGLVNVLKGNLRGLVQVLNQIKEEKE